MSRFCEQCGQPRSSTAKFCAECGAPAEQAKADIAEQAKADTAEQAKADIAEQAKADIAEQQAEARRMDDWITPPKVAPGFPPLSVLWKQTRNHPFRVFDRALTMQLMFRPFLIALIPGLLGALITPALGSILFFGVFFPLLFVSAADPATVVWRPLAAALWPEPSPDSALSLLRAASANNGGGLLDCGHLYYETDCGDSRCQPHDGKTCPHGYLSARDSAKFLGWITANDNVTDKGSAALVAAAL